MIWDRVLEWDRWNNAQKPVKHVIYFNEKRGMVAP